MHGGESNTTFLSDALVILGAAGIVIPIFARFKITPIIGFILVGVAVGPLGLGSLVDEFPWLYHVTITDPESIEPFAEFGIVLLLFSIGLELSFNRLWALRRMVFGVGAAELGISALLIGLILFALGQNWAGSLGLGLALALSSTALVLPMSGTTSPVGRNALAMLLFEDLALVPIIFLLGALAPNAGDEGWGGLINTLWMGGLTIGIMLVGGRFFLPRLFGQAARTKSPELFLAISLLIVIVASLATAAVGLSPIVGALLAGLLIAETEYHTEVEVITAPFKGLALGVFLLTVGMRIDLNTIAASWVQFAIAVVGVVVVKTVVTTIFLRIAGIGRATATETAVLMSAPSETTLIVLATATTAQLIQPSTATFWTIVTAIGLTITPLLARVGHNIARKVEAREQGRGATDPEELAGDEAMAVIIGFGRVGRLIADMMTSHGQKYVAVESDIDTVLAARREGYTVMFGDVGRAELLDSLRLGHARALILTMDQPVMMARIVRKVRGWLPDLPIIARARSAEHASELYRAGATLAVPETLESSLQLSEAVLVELGMPMGPVIASIHEKRDEFRRQIMEAGGLTEKPKLKTGV